MTSTKFKDYPQEQIDAKLKQVEEFESKFGVKLVSESWRKWCTDAKYRQNEWQFRQNIANSIKPNVDYKQFTNIIQKLYDNIDVTNNK